MLKFFKKPTLEASQAEICLKNNSLVFGCAPETTIGVADNVKRIKSPINGLRILPKLNSNGWFIWAGDTPSDADDFFKPNHLFHFTYKSSPWMKFLALEPGWRFYWTPNFEDVWFDSKMELE